MKKVIKLGLIGGGINSTIAKAHYSALSLDKNFEIVSGCFSRNTHVNKISSEYLKIDSSRYYKKIEDFLKNEKQKIDAILILSDTPSHFSHIKNSININLPIICEKPSVSSLKEYQILFKELDNNKINLYPIYNYLGYPIIRDIKNFIDKNYIGKVDQINLTMPQQGLTIDKIKNVKKWRLKDGNYPTIQLDLGVHLLSLIKFIFPKEKATKLITNQIKSKKLKIVHTEASWLLLTNQIFCNLEITKNSIGDRNGLNLEIRGSKGKLMWYQIDPENLIYHNKVGKKVIMDRGDKELKISSQKRYNRYTIGHPYGFIEALANYYQDIYNSINNQRIRNKTNILNYDDELFIYETLDLLNKPTNRWIKD